MPIHAICLLKVPSLPLPTTGPVRVEALDDSVLLHTSLDFADDPEDVAAAVRSLVGETLAVQHQDPRGLFLVPSVAVPKSRRYDQVVEEVADGGVWAPWSEELGVASQLGAAAPDLGGMLGAMLGQMPEGMFERAAAGLRDDPSALKDAAAQLPGMLQNPGALQDLLQQGSSQMPELAGMLKGLGLDMSSPEMSKIASGLQDELSRDPSRLLAMAESLFAGGKLDPAAFDEDDEDDAEQDDDEKA
jgi:hypothetical protein